MLTGRQHPRIEISFLLFFFSSFFFFLIPRYGLSITSPDKRRRLSGPGSDGQWNLHACLHYIRRRPAETPTVIFSIVYCVCQRWWPIVSRLASGRKERRAFITYGIHRSRPRWRHYPRQRGNHVIQDTYNTQFCRSPFAVGLCLHSQSSRRVSGLFIKGRIA